MLECTYKSTTSWQQELIKNHNELMSQLDNEKKDYLKKAQQDWIEYKESEILLIKELYLTLDGTMYIIMAASEKLEIVKSRAIRLKEHLDILNLEFKESIFVLNTHIFRFGEKPHGLQTTFTTRA